MFVHILFIFGRVPHLVVYTTLCSKYLISYLGHHSQITLLHGAASLRDPSQIYALLVGEGYLVPDTCQRGLLVGVMKSTGDKEEGARVAPRVGRQGRAHPASYRRPLPRCPLPRRRRSQSPEARAAREDGGGGATSSPLPTSSGRGC